MRTNNGKAEILSVIFDMDGLMFDTEILFYETQNKMLKKRGRVMTSSLKQKMMGRKIEEAISVLLNELDINETIEVFFNEQFEELKILSQTKLKPMVGLFELLDFLENLGLRKAVATSASRAWADIIFDKFYIGHHFEFIITGDNISYGKPNPEIYLKSVEKLGLDPQNCLVLEDSLNGVKAANAAGCFSVAVPNPTVVKENFNEAGLVVEKLNSKELFEFIETRKNKAKYFVMNKFLKFL